MGNLFGGGESHNNTVTNQTYTADPRISAAGGQALSMAQGAASSPFQMPVAPVAGFSPLQQQAFNQYQALQGYAQPYYDTARNLYSQSAAPISATDVNQYFNPMSDKILAAMNDAYGASRSQALGSAISRAGGVGADRIGVTEANLASKHELDTGATMANLYQQALQAAQMQKQREAGAAQGFTGLGTTAFGTNLQGTGALSGAGQLQQRQTQAELNAPYQNTLARIAYPFQSAQYLAGITGGLAPALGGTTGGVQNTTTTPAQPSMFNQIGGLALSGLGLAGGMGAFGGGNPAFGGNGVWGGSSGNPLPGLGPEDYGAGFAEGGEVEGEDDQADVHIPGVTGDHNLSPIPYIPMQSGAGHSGPLTGGINFPQPQQGGSSGGGSGGGGGLGSLIGAAANILPFFLKDGGSVPGYDDGGALPDDPISMWAKPLPDTSMWDQPLPPTRMWPAAARTAPAPQSNPFPTAQQPPIMPSPGLPAPIAPKALSAPAPRVAAKPAPVGGGAAAPASDDMESNKLPYPDATERDWGQNLTRSPWMALVQAGATMASTPGGIGTALGKGMLAGAKGLDEQRKELRSEEELNQKARQLYQQAKTHLDKYNKMTPYERASIALRNRELDQEESGVAGKPGKFTGADYDRAAKFVQSQYPGVAPQNLQPLIDAEVARRRRYLAAGTAAATAADASILGMPIGAGVGGGDTAANALADPGPGGRVKGKWYVGPSGKPQQWLGQ